MIAADSGSLHFIIWRKVINMENKKKDINLLIGKRLRHTLEHVHLTQTDRLK